MEARKKEYQSLVSPNVLKGALPNVIQMFEIKIIRRMIPKKTSIFPICLIFLFLKGANKNSSAAAHNKKIAVAINSNLMSFLLFYDYPTRTLTGLLQSGYIFLH